jgi:hypothetical protein
VAAYVIRSLPVYVCCTVQNSAADINRQGHFNICSHTTPHQCILTLRLLMSYIYIYIYIYMEHLSLMFLDHTQRRSTVGRTLDERSACRRDLYLTTHDTHNRQISMPPVGVETTISVSERPIYIYIYDIRSLRVNDLSLILLTWRKW